MHARTAVVCVGSSAKEAWTSTFSATIVAAHGRESGSRVPRVEATACHAQAPAENGHRMLGLLRRDEGKPHRLCFAKNAAAFFRMSRSSSTIRSLLAEPRQLLAFGRRQAGLALRAIGLRLLGPMPPSADGDQVELARHRADALAFLEHQPDGAGLELLREPPACPPACVSAAIPDIVSAFRKMSTKPDQAHSAS